MADKEKLKQRYKKIRKKFQREGFEISDQAIRFLLRMEEWDEDSDYLVNLAKKRRYCIGGGDVLKFIMKRKLAEALSVAEDVVER